MLALAVGPECYGLDDPTQASLPPMVYQRHYAQSHHFYAPLDSRDYALSSHSWAALTEPPFSSCSTFDNRRLSQMQMPCVKCSNRTPYCTCSSPCLSLSFYTLGPLDVVDFVEGSVDGSTSDSASVLCSPS